MKKTEKKTKKPSLFLTTYHSLHPKRDDPAQRTGVLILLEEEKRRLVCAIFDECHNGTTKRYKGILPGGKGTQQKHDALEEKIIKNFVGSSVATTASPVSSTHVSMCEGSASHFGEFAHEMTTKDAEEHGVILQCRDILVPVPMSKNDYELALTALATRCALSSCPSLPFQPFHKNSGRSPSKRKHPFRHEEVRLGLIYYPAAQKPNRTPGNAANGKVQDDTGNDDDDRNDDDVFQDDEGQDNTANDPFSLEEVQNDMDQEASERPGNASAPREQSNVEEGYKYFRDHFRQTMCDTGEHWDAKMRSCGEVEPAEGTWNAVDAAAEWGSIHFKLYKTKQNAVRYQKHRRFIIEEVCHKSSNLANIVWKMHQIAIGESQSDDVDIQEYTVHLKWDDNGREVECYRDDLLLFSATPDDLKSPKLVFHVHSCKTICEGVDTPEPDLAIRICPNACLLIDNQIRGRLRRKGGNHIHLTTSVVSQSCTYSRRVLRAYIT